jgi:hypothetical protein
MESNGSRNSVVSIRSRRAGSTSPTGRRKKRRSAPKRKIDPTKVLPPELLRHVSSFLHPVNRVALRQTSTQLHNDINRYRTKRNVIPTLRDSVVLFPRERQALESNGLRNANLNRILMRTSGRKYMKSAEARKYLEEMFKHKGSGNLFGTHFNRPLVFPAMSGATPTDKQRLALAQAITSDTSNEGTQFMYKLIKKIKSRRYQHGRPVNGNKVHHLSHRSMASMYSKPGPGRREV